MLRLECSAVQVVLKKIPTVSESGRRRLGVVEQLSRNYVPHRVGAD